MLSVRRHLVILTILWTTILTAATSLSLPAAQYNALHDLYRSTNGEQWQWDQPYSSTGYPWDFSSSPAENPCSALRRWQGVNCTSSCDSSPCDVLSLSLRSHNLVGTIPSTLSDLRHLQVLDLSENGLHGEIPASIGKLTALLDLDFSSNSLSGTVPASLGDISGLRVLNLYSNQLRGTIAAFLGEAMTQLEVVGLYSNQFSGTIPAALGNMTGLELLNLYDNPLTGTIPAALGQMEMLRFLNLQMTLLSGTIPPSFGALVQLQLLALSDTDLSGNIPPSLGNCSQLVLLDLSQSSLTGTVPPSLGALTSLLFFSVSLTSLTGTIPEWLGNLHSLRYLSFSLIHTMHGSIPSSIGSLTALETMDFAYSSFSGSIPPTIGNLTALQSLEMQYSQFSGALPPSMGNLVSLSSIDLSSNAFTGSIPQSLFNLRNLVKVTLSYNALSGRLPDFGALTQLELLWMNENVISGTIPLSVERMKSLLYWNAKSNRLSGTIPAELGALTMMETLQLGGNKLTGEIPPAIGNMTGLFYVSLSRNALTGEIPSALSNIQNLLTLDLSHNLLSRTIPSAFSIWGWNFEMYLESNLLTGTISPTFAMGEMNFAYNALSGTVPSLQNMTLLYLNNNQLSGSVADITCQLDTLFGLNLDLSTNLLSGTLFEEASAWMRTCPAFKVFVLSSNLFSGTIPPDTFMNFSINVLDISKNSFVGTLPKLYSDELNPMMYVDLSSNSFSGTIPTEYGDLSSLQYLYLASNRLFGTIPPGLGASPALTHVSLSSNQLTSSIPASLFAGGGLQYVFLSSNCFSGTLPFNAICRSVSLENLVLDGLHSSSSCIHPAIAGMQSSGHIIRNGVHGTLPVCVFELLSLSVFHVGGNMLSGSFPAIPIFSSALGELVASNNALTGSLPSSLWTSNISVLDLSVNRLQGTLPDGAVFGAGSTSTNLSVSVTLRVNQLSGTIPAAFLSLSSVDILESNMFACRPDRSDLPRHDPSLESYGCGSDTTNYALITFGIALVLCMTVLVAAHKLHWQTMLFDRYLFDNDDDRSTNLDVLPGITKLLATVSWYVIVMGMIVYGVLKVNHSTYRYTYVWTVTAMYVRGVGAGVVTFLFLSGAVFVVVWYLRANHKCGHFDTNHDSSRSTTASSTTTTGLNVLLVLCNVVVIMTVNGAYVYAVNQGYTVNQLLAVSFAMSVFKLVWNFLIMGNWNNRFSSTLTNQGIVFLSLFNNLIAPFLAAFFVSPDCFLYIVSKAPQLTFNYAEESCTLVGPYQNMVMVCNINQPVDAISPFHYSHECSFTLLADYVYVFIFRYVLSGIVEPLLLLAWKNVQSKYKINMFRSTLFHLTEESMDVDRLARKLRIKLTVDMSMLLAYGTLCPPLALVISVSVAKDIWMIRLAIGSVKGASTDASEQERLAATAYRFNQVMKDTEPFVWEGIWYGLCTSVWIWSFVLFDIMSPDVGVLSSIPIVVTMIVLPHIAYYVALKWNTNLSGTLREQNAAETEMAELQKNPHSPAEEVKNVLLEG